jgi:hypothetical protein
MVETAIDETMTMDVADEKPPRNARSASAFSSAPSGSVRTYRSGFDPAGNRFRPAIAIGSTKRQIRNR